MLWNTVRPPKNVINGQIPGGWNVTAATKVGFWLICLNKRPSYAWLSVFRITTFTHKPQVIQLTLHLGKHGIRVSLSSELIIVHTFHRTQGLNLGLPTRGRVSTAPLAPVQVNQNCQITLPQWQPTMHDNFGKKQNILYTVIECLPSNQILSTECGNVPANLFRIQHSYACINGARSCLWALCETDAFMPDWLPLDQTFTHRPQAIWDRQMSDAPSGWKGGFKPRVRWRICTSKMSSNEGKIRIWCLPNIRLAEWSDVRMKAAVWRTVSRA